VDDPALEGPPAHARALSERHRRVVLFEKQIPKGTPDWIARVTIPKPEGRRDKIDYVVL